MKKRRNSLIINLLRHFLAEREGFEPPAPLSAAVFKTAVIDHSTISPDELLSLAGCLVALFGCKDRGIFCNMQGMGRKIWAVLGILLGGLLGVGGFEGLLEALLGDREGVGRV